MARYEVFGHKQIISIDNRWGVRRMPMRGYPVGEFGSMGNISPRRLIGDLWRRLLSSFFTDRAIYRAITVGDDLYIITLSSTDIGTRWWQQDSRRMLR